MNLKDHFPRASKSFLEANPLSAPSEPIKTSLTGNGDLRNERRGRLNKTESEFAMILEAMKRKGEIRDYKFESVKIRVGEGCFYIPDFFVDRWPDKKPLFIEVKGFLRDDARVKFLASKDQHQWADFEMWRKDRKTGWTRII